MDIEAFADSRAEDWNRLDALAKRRRLTGAQADELVWLYQRTATDLSQVRSAAPDPALVSRLSVALAAARGRIAGSHEASWTAVRRFVQVTMPVALYRMRWWSLWVSVVCVLVGLAAGLWVVARPEAMAALMTPREQERYVSQAFTDYYSEYSQASFSALVWTNNARLAALAIAAGFTGLFPAYLLFNNSVMVGATGGMMWNHDAGWVFFATILPHGLLELTSVFVAGAAGLRLCWAWLVPGPRTRGRALAEEGRATITVALALVGSLAISGLIEGFVTPSGLPAGVKLAIGGAALAGFVVYFMVLGRRAVRSGFDADVDAELVERPVPVAG